MQYQPKYQYSVDMGRKVLMFFVVKRGGGEGGLKMGGWRAGKTGGERGVLHSTPQTYKDCKSNKTVWTEQKEGGRRALRMNCDLLSPHRHQNTSRGCQVGGKNDYL